MTSQEKLELCLRLYNDIINGYSVFHDNGEEVFIKHLKDSDYAFFEDKKSLFKKIAAKKGLHTEKEFYQILEKTGNWSREDEESHERLSLEIKNLNKSKEKLFVESQKNIVDTKLKEKEKEFREIDTRRKQVRVNTVEEYADNKINDFILCYTFYKDADLSTNLFSFEDFQEISVEETYRYTQAYYGGLAKFSNANIKRVAHCTFFLNSYLLSKSNPYYFIGKPIKDFTTYQSNLCSFGNGCKSILENSDNTLPDLEDIDDVVDWFNRERDIINKKHTSKPSSPSQNSSSNGKSTERFEAVSYLGATKEEVNQIAASEDAKPINFVQAAEKLKKELNKDTLDTADLLKLHM